MCTAITLQSTRGENFFGRTMDFSYDIKPGIYIIPKGYTWNSNITAERYIDHYNFICMGQEKHGMLGFFDGVNEKGFAAASLYFLGDAYYNIPISDKRLISSLDFLHYILGNCSSIEDLTALTGNVDIIGEVDPITNTVAPLHWIATDRSGKCVVVEQTKAGLNVINNPIGVMANSPDFKWHMTNLRNYMDISVRQKKESNWGNVSLTPFGQGGGSINLPGGFTSPERFVRAAFLKTHIEVPQKSSEAVMACFHIMNSVSIPKCIVITDKGTCDYTRYIAFMSTNTCEYYFKTHDNDEIMTVSLYNYYKYDSLNPIFLGNIMELPKSFQNF